MGIGGLILRGFLYAMCILTSVHILAQDSTIQKSLPSVVIIDQKRNFIEKDDTIIYNAKAFMHKEVHKVKDLLSNMPGFSVDPTGRVMFNGKEVKYVMINGEDLTGNKYETITKNLQAGLISKVELVKRYHENRLLSGFEWGEDQAVNLVIDENKKYKINMQASLGISSVIKKKEMDANVISLYKKTSTVVFLDANNSGRTSNNNYSTKDPELFRLPNSQAIASLSPDFSENYWRCNNDKEFNIHQAYKPTQYLSLKTQVKSLSQMLSQHRNLNAAYYFPETDPWKYVNHQYNQLKLNQNEVGLNAKYDNLKKHTSAYQINIGNSSAIQHEIQLGSLPIQDTAQTTYADRSVQFLVSGNEYVQINKKYILECEARFMHRHLGDELKITSAKLPFLPDIFSGSSKVFNDASAMEQHFQIGTKILFKNKHSYNQVGWKMDNQYIRTANRIQAIKWQDSMIQVNNDAIYRNNRIQVYWKREEALNKHLYWSYQSGLGVSNAFWGEHRSSAITGYISSSLQDRKTSFKQTHVGLTLSRGNPDKNTFFVSPILNNQTQVLYGSRDIVFPMKAKLHFMKTYNDLYKGLSCTFHVSIDQQMHSLHATSFQYPYYSIRGFYIGKRNAMMYSIGKIQKNIFPWRIKPFAEIQYNNVSQDQLLNDVSYKIGSISTIYRIGCVSYWNTKMNVETNIECRYATLNIQSVKDGRSTMDRRGKADLKVKYDLSKNIYASMYGMLLWNKQFHYSSVFMDAYLEYKLSDRLMGMIRVHNLFNTAFYKERMIAPYMFQETGLNLISRYLMFSVQINL